MTGSPGGSLFLEIVREMLRASHTTQAGQLSTMANQAARPAGVSLQLFLVDYEQQALHSLPDDNEPTSATLPIDGTLAGLAFQTVSIRSSGSPPDRIWAPLLDGTVRLGVLLVHLPTGMDASDRDVRDGCLALASLLGHLIQVKTALGDGIEAVRRTRPMSASSELVWKLVAPPTYVCPPLVISAVLEPSYDAGGDGYDYSVDAGRAHIVLLDAMGHGLDAALTCAAALSAMRATRRAGGALIDVAAAADTAIRRQWNDFRFATAILAEIDLHQGTLTYINAGHPPPAVVRGRRIVRRLDAGRRLPLGLHREDPRLGVDRLQPGDRLLFYTDGITEAQAPDGTLFGLDRLVELTERHAASGLPTAEVIRRVTRAVLDHQKGVLQDDATLLMVEWMTDAPQRDLP